jgi:hypothetical protein
MAGHPRRPPARADADGVRILEDAGVRRVAWVFGSITALVIAATVVVLVLLRFTPGAGSAEPGRRVEETVAPPAPAPVPPPAAVTPSAPAATHPPAPVARRKPVPPAVPPAAPPASLPALDARDVIRALRDAGETGGLAAFPEPGTKPTRTGIVVPDDFALPPGYVRHYQTTDDGKPLPPILMFHPDYEFVDAQGQPVALPESRIVPPEMAPSGLPIRTLDPAEPAPAPGAGMGTRP